MKITAKARYALRILLDLAVYGEEKPRTIREIAQSQDISEKFISRIVVTLRRGGLIGSVRGVQGGLRLARFPESVTLLEIVECMDGPVSLLECLSRPGRCPRQGRCVAEDVWRRVNDDMVASLRGIRLSEIVERYRERRAGPGADSGSGSRRAEGVGIPRRPRPGL